MKMRTKRKSKVLGNTKTIIVTMTTLFFLTVTGFYLFNWYINIDIKEPIKKESYTAERTSETVADVKEENKQVSEVIENVSKCVEQES